ncbi:hypothetical protein OEZ85_008622 [Tetradesmus obliquus]|uniref:Large ribosomal subunit protein uL30m n=1 Tax=Tetradesmus obliquus TaxID=3088 RepID=A0ABY8TLC2_TETOB|nr:hypothetical protein OEZ85_008622 [Tetradesmus obliquus]
MGQQPIKTFFVTLRRSQIGKPWFHRQVLDGLGLKKRLLCVEKPNNPVIRGMLRKVAHLVVIETDQMYYNRKVAEYEAAKLRPPVIVRHDLPAGFAAAPALQAAAPSSQQQPRI